MGNRLLAINYYLTGSYPLPPQGPHRAIRFAPIQLPFSAPYFVIASMVYCEHVGVYLQAGIKCGEIAY